MKCLNCNRDSKFSERTNGRCPGCHAEFAFEPRRGALLTDMAFQHAIDAVSAKGQLRWGVEHLYYEICRRKKQNPLAPLLATMFIGVPIAAVLTIEIGSVNLLLVALLLLLGLGVFLTELKRRRATASVAIETFDKMWRRWVEVHGAPAGVITRLKEPVRPLPAEPDIGDYSFDRAVICDRARTVDLLLANNFHFENNCAVLAVDGYPGGPFETVRAMLRRNPHLQVFALHDATFAGCQLANQLATDPNWFKDQARVTDVGLRPRQCRPFNRLRMRAPRSAVAAGAGITPEEAVWLAHYTLELAAVHPEQILRRLSRVINQKFDQAADDTFPAGSSSGGSGIDQDSASFSTVSDDSDSGADGFG